MLGQPDVEVRAPGFPCIRTEQQVRGHRKQEGGFREEDWE